MAAIPPPSAAKVVGARLRSRAQRSTKHVFFMATSLRAGVIHAGRMPAGATNPRKKRTLPAPSHETPKPGSDKAVPRSAHQTSHEPAA